jgi:hypothetical protein
MLFSMRFSMPFKPRSGGRIRRVNIKINRKVCRCIAFAVCLAGAAGAVQLHNWRLPYYTVAAEMELLSGSPSGMFWDELGSLPLCDSAMGPDTAALKRNHWTIEPAYAFGVERPAPASGRPLFWQLEVLNNARYRSLSAHQTLHADRRYDYDPLYPANHDRFARGRIENAYLQLDWQHGFIRFGRLMRNWGPFIDRSLVLSSNPYTCDALEWQVHSSIFEFRHLFAAFASSEHFLDSADNLPGRFLAGHALNVMFGRWATIGITETVVFRRADGFPDFQYVNPFSVYSVTNTNQEGTGNLMLGLQWNVHPGLENLSIRGQCALDDFQVDHRQITDREPPHWGLDAGVYWRDCLPLRLRHLLKAGYQRRSEWIYTVMDRDRNQGEGYTYLSQGLGAPKNDGDSVWAGFSVIGKKWWVGTACLSYARQGERTDTSRWRDSDPGNTIGLPYDYLQKPFPSGIVQSTITFALGGAAYYKDYADARLSFANRWVKNKNHRNAPFVYDPLVSFELGIHFSGIFVRLPE